MQSLIITTSESTHYWMLRKTSDTPPDICDDVDTDDSDEAAPKRFRCKNCNTPIAFHHDVISVEDIPSESIQINPNGFIHEVITVSRVQNTLQYGDSVPADTWFPGFCWKYLLCKECMEFLGWSYHSPNEQWMTFAGLSRQAIHFD